MPQFTYEALTPEGTVTRGSVDAATEFDLETRLRMDGLYLIRADIHRDPAGRGASASGSASERTFTDGRVRRTELLAFTEYLHGSAQAGIPILTTLEDLESQLDTKLMRQVTAEIRESMVEEGSSLSKAMSEHPQVFSNLYVATIEAGEATGQLDYATGQLVDYLEWQQEISLQIRQATMYPMIVLAVMAILIVLLVTFVYPRLLPIFEGFDVELPLPTRIVLWVGATAREQWIPIAAAVMAAPALWKLIGSTPRGRFAIDTLKLRLPVFGPLMHQLEMARVVTYMALFYRTGVDLLRGLTLLSQMVTNARVSRAIDQARSSIADGESIAQSMAATGLFPPIVVRSIALGESTGKLDEALERARAYYGREVPAAVRRMIGALQPMMIVVLGGILATVALSIFLPIVRIYQSVSQ